jgi:hypothetical protein
VDRIAVGLHPAKERLQKPELLGDCAILVIVLDIPILEFKHLVLVKGLKRNGRITLSQVFPHLLILVMHRARPITFFFARRKEIVKNLLEWLYLWFFLQVLDPAHLFVHELSQFVWSRHNIFEPELDKGLIDSRKELIDPVVNDTRRDPLLADNMRRTTNRPLRVCVPLRRVSMQPNRETDL